jgi:hypothetical protein
MNYLIKNKVRGNEGIKKEKVLRMHGSRKHEIKSLDAVPLNAIHHQQQTTFMSVPYYYIKSLDAVPLNAVHHQQRTLLISVPYTKTIKGD